MGGNSYYCLGTVTMVAVEEIITINTHNKDRLNLSAHTLAFLH